MGILILKVKSSPEEALFTLLTKKPSLRLGSGANKMMLLATVSIVSLGLYTELIKGRGSLNKAMDIRAGIFNNAVLVSEAEYGEWLDFLYFTHTHCKRALTLNSKWKIRAPKAEHPVQYHLAYMRKMTTSSIVHSLNI